MRTKIKPVVCVFRPCQQPHRVPPRASATAPASDSRSRLTKQPLADSPEGGIFVVATAAPWTTGRHQRRQAVILIEVADRQLSADATQQQQQRECDPT